MRFLNIVTVDESLRDIQPPPALFEAMGRLMDAAGLARRGVYVFSLEPGNDKATLYSRMFGFGVTEDPAIDTEPAWSADGSQLYFTSDRSGWWMLLWLIPIIGWIVILVFLCQRPTPGQNRFG